MKTILLEQGYVIIGITFLVAYVPMLTMSICSDTFGLNSTVDFPFITIPSIFIGDALFLPYFNFRAYLFFKQFLIQKSRRKFLSVLVILGLLLSFILNAYTHYIWANDQYTGFMDTSLGTLSPAGWYHYAFSVVEMAVVFVFLISVFLIKNHEVKLIVFAKHAALVLLGFSMLSVVGFFLNHFIFFNNKLFEIALEDWLSMTTVPIALFIVLLIEIRHRRSS